MGSELFRPSFAGLPRVSWIASGLLHVGALVGFWLFQHYSNFHFENQNREKVESFIQVDVLDLPQQLVTEQRAEPLEPLDPVDSVKTKTSSQPPEMVIPNSRKKTTEKDLKKEREKILKELEAEAQREKALAQLTKKQKEKGMAGRAKIKGNMLSQGTSVKGKIGTLSDRYNATLTEAIRAHFNIFPWQRKKDLVAVVQLSIFNNGRVRSKRIVQKSTDPQYDSAVLHAIDRAQPFPLPSDLSVLKNDFTIEFRPEE